MSNEDFNPLANRQRPTDPAGSASPKKLPTGIAGPVNVAAAERIHEDPELAHTLPSRYYYDRDIFEREKEAIFYRSWHPIAHTNELTQPGDYVTLELFDQSVIVVRGSDGVVRGFHNVCQHRGSRLINSRRGNLGGQIICPYHAWTYDLDGRLAAAPRSGRIKNFNKNTIGLRSICIEAFANFYFVNLDAHAEPLYASMPGAAEVIRQHCPDLEALEFHSETEFVVDANWKVIIDNAIESYHVTRSGPVHRASIDLYEIDQWERMADAHWWGSTARSKRGTTRAFGKDIGATYQTDRFFDIYLWPGSDFYTFAFTDFLGTFLIIPIEPEKTLLRLGYYAPPRPLHEVTTAGMKWMIEELGPEDIELNVGVQKGLRSFGYDRGRYMVDANRDSESELQVHRFHSLVYQAVWS